MATSLKSVAMCLNSSLLHSGSGSNNTGKKEDAIDKESPFLCCFVTHCTSISPRCTLSGVLCSCLRFKYTCVYVI